MKRLNMKNILRGIAFLICLFCLLFTLWFGLSLWQNNLKMQGAKSAVQGIVDTAENDGQVKFNGRDSAGKTHTITLSLQPEKEISAKPEVSTQQFSNPKIPHGK